MVDNVDALRRLIRSRRGTVIVGAGISKAITPQAPSWLEAISRAIEYALSDEYDVRAIQALQELNNRLKSGDVNVLEAATLSQKFLDGPNSRRWHAFIREEFGKLRVKNKLIAQQIKHLGLRIATTNYDTLFDRAIGAKYYLPSDPLVIRKLDSNYNYVLHLHGVHHDPYSVLWSKSDYDSHLLNRLSVHVRDRISEDGLILIGCGGTIDDPNFLHWREFLDEISPISKVYRLYCHEESHTEYDRYLSVSYGDNYFDLGNFLLSLSIDKGKNSYLWSLDYPDNYINTRHGKLSTNFDHISESVIEKILTDEMIEGRSDDDVRRIYFRLHDKVLTAIADMLDPEMPEYLYWKYRILGRMHFSYDFDGDLYWETRRLYYLPESTYDKNGVEDEVDSEYYYARVSPKYSRRIDDPLPDITAEMILNHRHTSGKVMSWSVSYLVDMGLKLSRRSFARDLP